MKFTKHRHLAALCIVFGVLAGIAPHALAQDLLDFDLGGDETTPAPASVEAPAESNHFTHTASLYTLIDRQADVQHLKLGWRSVYHNTGNAQVDGHLEIKAFVDVADALGWQDWNSKTRDQYEADIDIGRAWLRFPLSDYSSLTVGRNVVVHGNADVLRQMDVVNTLDLRYPGNSDLNAIRMPRGMVEYRYSKDIEVSAIAAVEQTFTELPAAGAHFALSPIDIPRNKPRHWGASDYIINIKAEALGLVNQFQVARYLYGTPITRLVQVNTRFQPTNYFYPVQQVSIGNKHVGDSVELYSELSHLHATDNADLRKDATNWLLGVTYRGFANTQVQFEMADNAFDKQRQYAFNFRKAWMNDQLVTTVTYVKTHYRANAIGLGQAKAHGALLSLNARYEISDTDSVEAKWALFRESKNSPLRGWNKKDYVSVEYAKSF